MSSLYASTQRLGMQRLATARFSPLVSSSRVAHSPNSTSRLSLVQSRRLRDSGKVYSSTTVADGDDLETLDPETFWPYMEAAGDDLVVVDYYHVSCVKCKAIYPDLVDMAADNKDKQIKFVMFNCKKETKQWVTDNGVKMSPTFHLFRSKAKVAESVGAKLEKLKAVINEQQKAANKPEAVF